MYPLPLQWLWLGRGMFVSSARSRIHQHIFKDAGYDTRGNGGESLLAGLGFGLALRHLPQGQEHTANDDGHDVAAQNDARHSDDHAYQGEELTAQLAAPAFAQLLGQLLIRLVYILLFHNFLLIFQRRSGRDSPAVYPAALPCPSKRP